MEGTLVSWKIAKCKELTFAYGLSSVFSDNKFSQMDKYIQHERMFKKLFFKLKVCLTIKFLVFSGGRVIEN